MKRLILPLFLLLVFFILNLSIHFLKYNFVELFESPPISIYAILGIILAILNLSVLRFTAKAKSKKSLFIGLSFILLALVFFAIASIAKPIYFDIHSLSLCFLSIIHLILLMVLHEKLENKKLKNTFIFGSLLTALIYLGIMSVPNSISNVIPSNAELVLTQGWRSYYEVPQENRSPNYFYNRTSGSLNIKGITFLSLKRISVDIDPVIESGTWEIYPNDNGKIGEVEGGDNIQSILYTFHNELENEEEEDESHMDEQESKKEIDYFDGIISKVELEELINDVRTDSLPYIKGSVDLSYEEEVIKSLQKYGKNEVFNFHKNVRGIDTLQGVFTYSKSQFLQHCKDYLFDFLLSTEYLEWGYTFRHLLKSNYSHNIFRGEDLEIVIDDPDREYDVEDFEASYIIENLSRKPEEIEYLFNTYKDYIFEIIPTSLYNRTSITYTVDNLLLAYDGLESEAPLSEWADGVYDNLSNSSFSKEEKEALVLRYTEDSFIKKMGDQSYDGVSKTFWYTTFWIRRHHEGNIDIIHKILKEVSSIFEELNTENNYSSDIISRNIKTKGFIIGTNITLYDNRLNEIGEIVNKPEDVIEVVAVSEARYHDLGIKNIRPCDFYYYVKVKTANQEGWVKGRNVYRVSDRKIYDRFTAEDSFYLIQGSHYFGNLISDIEYNQECLNMHNPVIIKDTDSNKYHLIKIENPKKTDFPYLEFDLYPMNQSIYKLKIKKITVTEPNIIMNIEKGDRESNKNYTITITKKRDGTFSCSYEDALKSIH